MSTTISFDDENDIFSFLLSRNRLDYDAATLAPLASNFHRFYTKDHSDSSQHPKLVVTYE